MRPKKKNVKGNAKNFITRTQAVKKLQVSLADFRRLCIFKGIYPREPRNKKKANKGSTAPVTFYYHKDIQYLLHEPILNKFREHKTFSKKLNRAIGRKELNNAKRIEENRPKYKLDHVIKERYPTFQDALRDIDDPLNMLFLFSVMPATDRVSARITKDAHNLCNEWMAYVAKERAIRKVFVSIKGVYYEAVVKGVEIRWLVPFKFPQNIPTDIDFKIMLTFLEFYSTLLHFVLFKLYTGAGLIYPPKLDIKKFKGVGGLSAYILESEQKAKSLLPEVQQTSTETDEGKQISEDLMKAAMKAESNVKDDSKAAVESTEADEDEESEQVDNVKLDEFKDSNKNAGDSLLQPSKFQTEIPTLFEKFIFFIGREVPLDILEFLILSTGGKVISELALDELKLSGGDISDLKLDNITHQIVDRPKVSSKVQGRTYVQPQWVFDCINKATLLPVNSYLPGETLPPHLSPWGDAGGYNPEEKFEEEEGEEEEDDMEEEADETIYEDADEEVKVDEDEEEDEEEEDEDLKAQKELELEAKGVNFSEIKEESKKSPKEIAKQKKRKASSDKAKQEEEETEMKMIMMSNKKRKLYKKMKYSNDQKDKRESDLRQKKKKLEKAKSKLNKLNEKK